MFVVPSVETDSCSGACSATQWNRNIKFLENACNLIYPQFPLLVTHQYCIMMIAPQSLLFIKYFVGVCQSQRTIIIL